MNKPTHFIIIDEDSINNMLCKYHLKHINREIITESFLLAELGLEFITNVFVNYPPENHAVILLDINMPTWSGWDFLEHFDKLENSLKSRFKIYMLSSSVDEKDKQKAKENSNVVEFMIKPFDNEKAIKILSDY